MSGRGRRSIQYYDEIDRILGHRAASEPAVLLSSDIGEDNDATTIVVNTLPLNEIDEDNIDNGEFTSVM